MNNCNDELLVTIRCLAYNQEPYIRQCLDGFVTQKTNFRFEAIVHDDASTDGTASIIREYAEKYPKIIKPIFETENQYSKRDGSLRRTMDAHMLGKYIAICEGDDYWIDPLKLQKQIDFLEANSEYIMCFANAIEHYEDNSTPDKVFSKVEDRDYSGLEIFENWQVATASVLFKRVLLTSKEYKAVSLSKKFIYGDTPLFCAASHLGKVRGMSDVVSVYRRNEGGVTTGEKTLSFWIKYYDHVMEFGEVFGGDFMQSSKKVAAETCFRVSMHFFRKLKMKEAILFIGYSLKNNALCTVKSLVIGPWRYVKTRLVSRISLK